MSVKLPEIVGEETEEGQGGGTAQGRKLGERATRKYSVPSKCNDLSNTDIVVSSNILTNYYLY